MNTSYCIGLCLLLAGNAIASSMVWEEYYENCPDEDIAYLTEYFNDPEHFKEFLMSLGDNRVFWPENIPLFKKKFDVQDKVARPVLLDIYRESLLKARWMPFSPDDTVDVRSSKRGLFHSIEWMGLFADEPVKQLLLGIATDDSADSFYRGPAIRGYLRCASAQNARDVLVRLLTGTGTVANHSEIYKSAILAYDEAEDDPQKREAILASMSVLLARESEKWLFVSVDKDVAKRSREYAESSQRLAILKRINKLPPSTNYGTDNDLNAALESYKSRKTFTSVSTNQTELMARDFRKPTGKRGQ